MSGDRWRDLFVQYLAHAVGKVAWLMRLVPSSFSPKKADAGYVRERRS
jgi:hypothetical protein